MRDGIYLSCVHRLALYEPKRKPPSISACGLSMLVALSSSSLIICAVVVKWPQPSWTRCDIQTSIEVGCYMFVRGTFGFEWGLETHATRGLSNSQSQKTQPCFAKRFNRPIEIKEQFMPCLETTTSWLEGPSARIQMESMNSAHWPARYLTVTFLTSL